MTTPPHSASHPTSQPHTDPLTQLIHGGRVEKKDQRGGINPPVVRASTLLFPNSAELQHAQASGQTTYGRHGSETHHTLRAALCELEAAEGCLLTPSGLAAATVGLLALLAPGDEVLYCDALYDPTRHFCQGLLTRWGVQARSYPSGASAAELAALWGPRTRVLLVESPGSQSLEMQDIPALAAVAHRHEGFVLADATWATPLGWRAFELGIDVIVHAVTKYISGHSDLLMGAILYRERSRAAIERTYRELGMAVGPDEAYLALRGLRTLAARMALHAHHGLQVARWLADQPEVEQVLYPPLPGAPGHALWQRDFSPHHTASLMAVRFHTAITSEQVDRLIDTTRLFGIGYSWGGFESLIIRSVPGRDHPSPNAGRPLARLHIGLESPDDLIADLEQAFAIAFRPSGPSPA